MYVCAQLCPALCDPVNCSLSGTSVHGILQATILEWVAIASSRDIPDPGTEPMSPALAGRLFTTEPAGKPHSVLKFSYFKVLLKILHPAKPSWILLEHS